MLSVTSGTTDTTDRILDAAYEELLHFGVKGVSVEDIAKRVGVARITIYRRFKSKDELLGAVAMREAQRVLARVDAAIDAHAELADQIVEGFVAVLHAVRSHPIVKRTLSSEPELVATFLESQAGRLIAMARDYVAARSGIDRAVAELIVRLSATFVLIPDSSIKLKTNDDARRFARDYLVPMVTR
jgi:AcrR family transcriptional regulator